MSQRILCTLVLSLILIASPALAQDGAALAAAPSHAVTALTPEQARRALDTLQDDTKRAQMIDTLRAIAGGPPTQASPSEAPSAGTPAQNQSDAKPDAQPQSKPDAKPDSKSDSKSESKPEPKADAKPEIHLNADSLAAQLLLTVSRQISELSQDVAEVVRTLTHFKAFYWWFVRTANDPYAYQQLFDIGWKLALVFACALAAEWLVVWLIRRPLAYLEARIPQAAREPAQDVISADPPSSAEDVIGAKAPQRRRLSLFRVWQSIMRLPFVLGRLLLELLPVVVFIGVATALLGAGIGDQPLARLVIVAVVNAYALSRGLICAVRALFSPFGLIRVKAETSAYIEIWARRIVAVAVSGICLANVALLLGLSRGGYWGLLRLVMLVVHLSIAVIILQCRRPVADLIRAPFGQGGLAARGRNRAAALWHYFAIAFDIGLWAVWALNIRNGYALMLQYFIGTIAVILVARLLSMVALGMIDRGFSVPPDVVARFPGLEARANRYLPLLRGIVAAIIAFAGLIAALEVWGVDAVVWFYGGQIGRRLLSALATILIAALTAAVVWEFSNALMQRQIDALSQQGHYTRAARLRTFQPMLRTTLLCLIATVVGLTALSEIGVNVAPLLAGAGIVGIAIGFGSQKLVQDLITGLFLLLENGVQVGDAVSVAGLSGTVENVSIRTIRLRAGDGAVHIVPFSAVTTITNSSRGAGNAAVSVSVAYKEDTDRAGEILKDIVAEMRREPEYRNAIRGDLDLWGVDKVDGALATLVGQIRCTDSGRWPVQREFNRRLKRRFQERGIEMVPSAQVMVLPMPVAADEMAATNVRRASA